MHEVLDLGERDFGLGFAGRIEEDEPLMSRLEDHDLVGRLEMVERPPRMEKRRAAGQRFQATRFAGSRSGANTLV